MFKKIKQFSQNCDSPFFPQILKIFIFQLRFFNVLVLKRTNIRARNSNYKQGTEYTRKLVKSIKGLYLHDFFIIKQNGTLLVLKQGQQTYFLLLGFLENFIWKKKIDLKVFMLHLELQFKFNNLEQRKIREKMQTTHLIFNYYNELEKIVI
ncbi:unnamed protein product [Paramecium octaurelia]|uniref:Uncharacterized protein n=1 Tax=Paramecium octaurelia TaxID=43137 RepID=A0A8S1TM04_PAROT|nr:unnamed protein product [Paramecium octaurelia]